MAELDDFVVHEIASRLTPGEQIQGVGFMHRVLKVNVMKIARSRDEWLVAVTNKRLVLMLTELVGAARPKAQCLKVMEWWYDELQAVTASPGPGPRHYKRMSLYPHPQCGAEDGGARAFDIWPQVSQLDGHAAFFAQFPDWLAQQVATGAFPMTPERRAQVDARLQARAASQHAAQEAATMRKGERKAFAGRLLGVLAPLLLGLGGLGVGGAVAINALDDLDKSKQSVEGLEKLIEIRKSDEKWASKGTPPPEDCPEKKLRRAGHFARSATCHMCRVMGGKPRDVPASSTVHKRGRTYWLCPPASAYARDVRELGSQLAARKERAGRNQRQAILGVLIAVVGLGLAAVWIALRRRRTKKATQDAMHPAPAGT